MFRHIWLISQPYQKNLKILIDIGAGLQARAPLEVLILSFFFSEYGRIGVGCPPPPNPQIQREILDPSLPDVDLNSIWEPD